MSAMSATFDGVRNVAGMALRVSRRARGWRVETREAFVAQVHIAAAQIENHPHLRTVWKLGREARILTINAKMQELLHAACSEAVQIGCYTDSVGALGEAYLGYWKVPFRIELDRRRRRELVLTQKVDGNGVP